MKQVKEMMEQEKKEEEKSQVQSQEEEKTLNKKQSSDRLPGSIPSGDKDSPTRRGKAI